MFKPGPPLCLAALLALAAAPAQGQVRASVRIGHSATIPLQGPGLQGGAAGVDEWLPCEVTLSNPSQQTLEGTLVFEETLTSDRRRPMRIERRVSLGAGAHQRLTFPVLYEDESAYSVRLLDADGGRVSVAMDDVAHPQLREPTQQVVLLARRGSDRRDHIGLQPKGKRVGWEDRPPEWLVWQLDAERLPRQALLYHRIDLLILDDLVLDDLTQAQQAAILDFVARGGVLWVSLRTRRPGPQAQALLDAFPGDPQEPRSLPTLRAVEAYTGTPCRVGQARSFMTFAAREGAVPWDDEAPVIVHGRFQQGLVVLAGFRFSDRLLDDPKALVRDLLQLRRRPVLPAPSAFERSQARAFEASLRMATRKAVPPLGTVVLLVGGYLVIGALLPFLLLKRSGRLEWAWAVVVGMSFFGMVAVDLLGRSYEQPDRAVRVSLVQGDGATPRTRTSYWGVFSKDGGALPLDLAEGATPYPFPDESQAAPQLPGPLRCSDGRVLLDTHPQDTTLLVTHEPCQAPSGISFRVSARGAATLDAPREVLEAWAFDPRGQPLRVRLPSSQELDDPDLLPALELAKQQVAQLAEKHARPLLLYRYRGALVQDALDEVGLDLGVLPASGWSPPGDSELLAHTVQPGEGGLPDDQVAFSWLPPPGHRPGAITLRWISGRRWRSQRGSSALLVSGYRPRGATLLRHQGQKVGHLFTTPLGTVRGRVQVKLETNHFIEVIVALRGKTQ